VDDAVAAALDALDRRANGQQVNDGARAGQPVAQRGDRLGRSVGSK